MDKYVAKQRSSSIEAFKILAIVLIVISHVVQTLELSGGAAIPLSGYGIALSRATSDAQQLGLVLLRYSGVIGNTIFFVCSSWFLLESASVRKQKLLKMLADIWTVSVVIMLVVLCVRKGCLTRGQIVGSLLPTTMENNWYLNCYMLFFAFHGMLNRLIGSISKRTMFRAAAAMTAVYLILSFFTLFTRSVFGSGSSFFSSTLIVWTVIYFIVGYLKLHAPKAADSIGFNVILAVTGTIGFYGTILATNAVGLRITAISKSLMIWNVAYNPFLIAMVIGAFNLIRRIRFTSKAVNFVSRLSLFIYIIHENKLLRTLYRPLMWNYVYENYGYSHIIFWVFVIAAIVFAFGLAASVIYYFSLHKLVESICNKAYPKLAGAWRSIENRLTNRSE